MLSLRTSLCRCLGVIALTTILTAQELRDTIGPLERRANPITTENPIPRRTQYAAPLYPAEARSLAATTTVVLTATVDESGCVAEIRRGPVPLLTTAVPAPTEAGLASAADAFVREAAAALRRWQYDRPAQPPISFSVSFTFKPGADAASTQIAAAVPLAAPAVSARPRAPEPVRVGVVSTSPRLVTRVEPVYPAQALVARVEGTVVLEIRIDVTGKVTNARVLRSAPLLDQAALDAVRQWVYAPTCLNGTAITLVVAVSVPFKRP